MAPPWEHDLTWPLGVAVPLGWATESIYLAVKKPCLLRKTVEHDSWGTTQKGLNCNANLVKKMMFTIGGILHDELSHARRQFRSSLKQNEKKKRKAREKLGSLAPKL